MSARRSRSDRSSEPNRDSVNKRLAIVIDAPDGQVATDAVCRSVW